jgi:hypothetical protein
MIESSFGNHHSNWERMAAATALIANHLESNGVGGLHQCCNGMDIPHITEHHSTALREHNTLREGRD